MRYVGTDDTGLITAITEVNQYGNFDLELTAGDEFTIKVSDIVLSHLEALPFDESADHHWLALYYEGNIVDFFVARYDFESKDQKRNRLKTRLYSLTRKFFDDSKVNLVEYDSGDSEKWNPTGAGYEVDINEGGVLRTDRWAFGLGDILDNISGSNNNGYLLNAVDHIVPVYGDGAIPLLHRGSGFSTSIYTENNAFNLTFQSLNITWYQLLKMTSSIFNSVFFVKPSITDDYLTIQLRMTRRSWDAPGDELGTRWLERNFIQEKYRIDGVRIAGADSYEYTQGVTSRENIQDFDISPFKGSDTQSDDETSEDIEISEANPDGFPITEYIMIDGSNLNRDYFDEVDVNFFHAINSGNGIEGSIIYNGVDLFQDLQIENGKSVKVFRIRISKDSSIADIEGLTGAE